MNQTQSKVMTVADMAQALGKGYRTVYRWVHDYVCQNGTDVCQNGTDVCQNGTAVSRDSSFTWEQWKAYLSGHLSEVELAGLDSLCSHTDSESKLESQASNTQASNTKLDTKSNDKYYELLKLGLEQNKAMYGVLKQLTETFKQMNTRLTALESRPSAPALPVKSKPSLPAPSVQVDSNSATLFKNGLGLSRFCETMGINMVVIMNHRCLPGTQVTYIRDEFPLFHKQRAYEYVQWVLAKVMNSSRRSEWLYSHPEWESEGTVNFGVE